MTASLPALTVIKAYEAPQQVHEAVKLVLKKDDLTTLVISYLITSWQYDCNLVGRRIVSSKSLVLPKDCSLFYKNTFCPSQICITDRRYCDLLGVIDVATLKEERIEQPAKFVVNLGAVDLNKFYHINDQGTLFFSELNSQKKLITTGEKALTDNKEGGSSRINTGPALFLDTLNKDLIVALPKGNVYLSKSNQTAEAFSRNLTLINTGKRNIVYARSLEDKLVVVNSDSISVWDKNTNTLVHEAQLNNPKHFIPTVNSTSNIIQIKLRSELDFYSLPTCEPISTHSISFMQTPEDKPFSLKERELTFYSENFVQTTKLFADEPLNTVFFHRQGLTAGNTFPAIRDVLHLFNFEASDRI